jgi:hypothetical protein
LVGFAKITRDVTERREANKALEEAREQLFQAQAEAVGLTGGVARTISTTSSPVILSGVDRAPRR